ncbi:MAG: hypothetical protein IMZ55_17655 [Acidobacteria bacterium]|nr:hypothetical protein [Acidobacteriota bacterium]
MAPLNPTEIEERILECSNRIARGVGVVSGAHETFLRAEHALDRAYARAYLDYDGPAHARRYAADLAVETERDSRDIADVAHQSARRQWQALTAELDALRSIGASVRQAYGATSG